MRALAEEFLLRHLDDGAIGGFLLLLYFATVFFTLDALCRWILSGHCEDLTTWGESGKVEKSKKTEVDEFEKIPAPPFTPQLRVSRLSCVFLSRHSTCLLFLFLFELSSCLSI